MSVKKRVSWVVIAVFALLIGIAGGAVLNQNYLIVRRYKPENVKTVWNQADIGFGTHLSQCAEIRSLLDAASAENLAQAMSMYLDYEYQLERFRKESSQTMSYAMHVSALLGARNGVFEWSKSAFQPRNYEALITYAEYSAEEYEPYCRILASLVTDQAAYEAYGVEYIALVNAAVDADVQVATSLYQLVYREFFGYRDIRKDEKTDLKAFESLSEKDQEDLLHLSLGDLWYQYFTRLEALWKAENQLAAYCEQMEL